MPPDTQPDHEPGARHRATLLQARAAHWRATRRLTAILLALWLATSFGTVFFARELAVTSLFGWPLSFYMAAQGAALVYLAIIGGYAWRMWLLDRRFARQLGEAA